MRNITLAILGLAAALALVAVGIGTAGAATVENWNGSEDVSDTFGIDNQTESVRVTAENLTNDQATVTVNGVENGTETELTSETITTDQSPDGATATPVYTTTWEHDVSDVNASEVKVEVSGDGGDSLSLAKVYVVAGGAGPAGGGDGGLGGLVPSGIPTVELIAGLLVVGSVAAAAVASRR